MGHSDTIIRHSDTIFSRNAMSIWMLKMASGWIYRHSDGVHMHSDTICGNYLNAANRHPDGILGIRICQEASG